MFVAEKKFSNNTLLTPIEKQIRKVKKYFNLVIFFKFLIFLSYFLFINSELLYSLFKVFKRVGIVPKISPIKIELV